ncbi:hypothetical protein BDP27DRAFT_173430 [Rhodocollybia butyracea]|uniref:DUF6593 domain-containing protein n=1 Tax=Rhodocollybia butyracea TaxID=206335 RepID=A0A9P5U2U3_9AGAR|nr:hypothetical protein BDP27DRAFT_173430 [Rhodocollybia butyracea]
MNTWLRKSVIPFDRTFSAPTNPGKKYQWKGRTLYSKDELRSITTFSPSQRKLSLRFTVVGMKPNTQSTPAKLVVDAQGKEVLDFIVISWSVLERQRRVRKRNARSFMAGGSSGSSAFVVTPMITS